MARRALRPRDAASLILYRRAGDTFELLMGRRSFEHVFMPGVYVFPGGRVDVADNRIAPAAELRAEVLARLTRSATARRAQALAIAAIRETFEETGLLLADEAPPAHWHEGIRPRLDRLAYVYRAITPPVNPRRFNTRFFLAPADSARGTIGGSGELEDIAWRSLTEAARVSTARVTNRVIVEVSERLNNPEPRDRPTPVSRRISGELDLFTE